VSRPDAFTEQIRGQADVWRSLPGLNDEQVDDLIRRDSIDILVDLALHMAGNRLLVFARKPAPVQVTFAGYPGTTGLSTMDYRLTDPYLDPPGCDESMYSEESVRLPDSFWCYDPFTTEPPVNPLPALSEGCPTFGCLNNFCKVNDRVLMLWARVLASVDRSHLVVLAPAGAYRRRVAEMFRQRGIAGERITFVPKQAHTEYLRQYHQIDIGLDTFPYNGHTTSLDSLWMGVPVVTLAGITAVSRAGVCQLQNLGLPELIAEDPDQYVQIAVNLAADLERLGNLRSSLRDRLAHSPLMNAPRFTRHIEAAYRSVWQRWCERSR
jgi:predicted O-linked N-acetylglucosamine transferase (SPINDLY family)